MRPKNGHLNVINRLDAALSFNIGDREKIQLLSSILEEMMALDVEPLIKTRYENLTTSTEIEELLQDQIYSINRESSDLCRKYINVLKKWDSTWKFPKGASMKSTFMNGLKYTMENIDRKTYSIQLVQNYITHSNVNLNDIDGLFDCFLNIRPESCNGEPWEEDDSILPILLKCGLKVPSDALDKYIARRSLEDRSPLCFELLIGECVSCPSEGLWYITKYFDHFNINTFLEWLCKGADTSKKFHGTNTIENLEEMDDVELKQVVIPSAIIIQSALRGWLARKRFAWNPTTSLGKFYALRDFQSLVMR